MSEWLNDKAKSVPSWPVWNGAQRHFAGSSPASLSNVGVMAETTVAKV
jgi:hypothetical protein